MPCGSAGMDGVTIYSGSKGAGEGGEKTGGRPLAPAVHSCQNTVIQPIPIKGFSMRCSALLWALLILPVFLTACEGIKSEAKYPANRRAGSKDIVYHGERETIFGEG